jgi:phosphate transport system permease protein
MEEELMSFAPRPAVQPWARVNTARRIQILLASVLPLAATVLIIILTGLDKNMALLGVFLPLQLIAAAVVGFNAFGKRGVGDAALIVLVIFFATFVLVLLASVVVSLVSQGAQAMSWGFFTTNNRYVSNTTSLEYGGVGHAIIGTLLVVGLTTVVTVPLGIAMAIYLTQSQSKTKGVIRTLTQAISGLPSVVAGLFILSIAITLDWQKSGLLGSMALLPLMLPTVARVAEEALRLVPVDLRYAALALGAPNYRAFFQVILPAAKSGLVTAILLGVARIIGETAPLILTVPISNGTSWDLFSGEIMTLPAYVYNYLGSAFVPSQNRAWGAALVLMILVAILFGTTRILSRSKSLKSKPTKEKASK